MRISRTLKAASIFRVNRDLDLSLIDLFTIGLSLARNNSRSRYKKYFRYLDDIVHDYGLSIEELEVYDYLCYYKRNVLMKESRKSRGNIPVLCRFYVKGNIVKYAILASFQPGVIGNIGIRLEESSYWKKVFMVEITSKPLRA